MRITLIITVAALFSSGSFAQDYGGSSSDQNGFHASVHFKAEPRVPGVIVTGAPYSADEVNEIINTRPDGSRRTEERPVIKLFRDSQGRTRRESLGRPPGFVVIMDPVAHLQYVLDIDKKIAHRQQLGPASERAVRPDPDSDNDAPRESRLRANRSGVTPESEPQITTEDLGDKTIEGVPAHGKRVTTVWREGMNGEGNEHSRVSETWRSDQLHALVLRKSTGSSGSGGTEKLINISLEEPRAELFRPPADYQTVDESGDFTLEINSGNGTSSAGQRGFPRVPQTRPSPLSNDQNPDSQGVYHGGPRITPPNLIHRVEPGYTDEAKRAKLKGRVLLSLVVDEKGVPRDVKVTQSLGMGLDEKALEAVMQWRFRPAMLDDRPVAFRAVVEVDFRLP